MKLIFLSLAIAIGFKAAAATYEKYPIKKGYQVSVVKYDDKSDTFLLEIVGESAVGPNYALSDDLAKAVEFNGGAAALRKQSNSSVGSIFQLHADLRLVTESEVERREKKATP